MTERQQLIQALQGTGLTAAEIARRVGRSQVAVWKWLHGKTLPNTDSIAALVDAFPELGRIAVSVVYAGRERAV